MDQEHLEKQLMCKLLDCRAPCFDILRKQYEGSSVLSRIFTGYGFFTTFSIPDELVVDQMTGEMSDVIGTFDDGDDYLGTRLTVENGRLDTLEAFSIGVPWPSKIEKVVLDFALDEGREFSGLDGIRDRHIYKS